MTEPLAHDHCLGLVKFGQRRYMEALLRGDVYFNSLRYFQTLEEGVPVGRGDPDDGLLRSYGRDVAKLTAIASDGRRFEFAKASLKVHLPAQVHVFCAVGITSPGVVSVHRDMLRWGDTIVFIRDAGEFVRRIDEVASAHAHRREVGFIEYVSRDKHAGSMGVFRKFDEHASEEEFRIALHTEQLEGPLTLNIGPIADIAEIHENPECGDASASST